MLLSILLAMHLQIYPQTQVQTVTEAKKIELSAEDAEPNIRDPRDWGTYLELIERNKVVIVKGDSLSQQKDKNAPQRSVEPNKGIKQYAYDLVVAKWGVDHWQAFDEIITRESGWNWRARNKSSGAAGLGQALPASKMGELGNTPEGQVQWVIGYIQERYGSPCRALAWHNSHNWY